MNPPKLTKYDTPTLREEPAIAFVRYYKNLFFCDQLFLDGTSPRIHPWALIANYELRIVLTTASKYLYFFAFAT